VVVDTSALLAVLFGEPSGPWCAGRMADGQPDLLMSTVNLAETLILVGDRRPQAQRLIREELFAGPIRFVAPDSEQALAAGEARLRFALNLGDCFAYALARATGQPILTLDRDFLATRHAVLMPPELAAPPSRPSPRRRG
jgi:ribonuclease VapC